MSRRRIYPDSQIRDSRIIAVSSALGEGYSRRLEDSLHMLRQRVKQAMKRGDFTKAIAILNRMAINRLAGAEDFNNRGLLHSWNGQTRKALSDFDKAIALDPELPAPYNNRANCLVTQGAKERALVDYERTIDLDPFHIRARINRAVTLRELGDYDAALEGFDEALLFRQMIGEVYAERGRTYHLRGDWNCAVADYHRALKFFPGSSETTTNPAVLRRQRLLKWLQQLTPAA